MPEEDAVKEIAGIEDENILITIHATESREAVKAAAKSRAVELSTGGEKRQPQAVRSLQRVVRKTQTKIRRKSKGGA